MSAAVARVRSRTFRATVSLCVAALEELPPLSRVALSGRVLVRPT